MKTQRPPEHHPGTPRRPAPEYSLLGCTNSQLRFTDHGLQSLFYFVDQCLVTEEEEDTEADHGEDRKQNEHDEKSDEQSQEYNKEYLALQRKCYTLAMGSGILVHKASRPSSLTTDVYDDYVFLVWSGMIMYFWHAFAQGMAVSQ